MWVHRKEFPDLVDQVSHIGVVEKHHSPRPEEQVQTSHGYERALGGAQSVSKPVEELE